MPKKKIRVGIFIARNLSTSTAPENTTVHILNNLDPQLYTAHILLLDQLIKSPTITSKRTYHASELTTSFKAIETHSNVASVQSLDTLTPKQLRDLIDVAIVAIYNTYGEDGRVIGFLETIGIPYISPGLAASVVCFDKTITKALFRDAEIPTPQGFTIEKEHVNTKQIIEQINQTFGFPVMVKTAASGASRGISFVPNTSTLSIALEEAFHFSNEALIEEYLQGDEYTIGIIGSHTNPLALPIVAIKHTSTFFDFDTKYSSGKAEEICPAPIDEELTKRIQKKAIQAYKITKCDSHARIDCIVKNGIVYILEINTFPGLTNASIFPKELEVSGSSLAAFLHQRIQEVIYHS